MSDWSIYNPPQHGFQFLVKCKTNANLPFPSSVCVAKKHFSVYLLAKIVVGFVKFNWVISFKVFINPVLVINLSIVQ